MKETLSITTEKSVEFATFEVDNRAAYHEMIKRYKNTKEWSTQKKAFSEASDLKGITSSIKYSCFPK